MNIGSLCTGYGGLDMALDGTTAWVSDIDKAACTLLAYRFPDVPNLGDLTEVDWLSVEPVDIITAGYPCQPFSAAGKRQGRNDARHIWPYIGRAIRVLRPRYVFLENVAGHLSLGFGDVLADLAQIGYDAQWTSIRASDVGACHGRNRVFILASIRHPGHDAGDAEQWVEPQSATRRASEPSEVAPTNAECCRRDRRTQDSRWQQVKRTTVARDSGTTPTHTESDGRDEGWPESARLQRGSNAPVRRSGAPTNADCWGLAKREELHREPEYGHPSQRDDSFGSRSRWGDYLPAVERWEHVTRRFAPNPTTTGNTGRAVLNPQFVEWMMGLPAGWVTDVPGISRTGQLHLLGNGVVPQQARAAWAVMA